MRLSSHQRQAAFQHSFSVHQIIYRPRVIINKTGSSAREHVLAIPELLEDILYRLNMDELLLAQRVSKSWLTTITSSIKLQRALFFKSIDKPTTSTLAFCYRLPSDDPSASDDPSDENTSPSGTVALLNPLLVKHFGRGYFDICYGVSDLIYCSQDQKWPLGYFSQKKKAAFRYKNASWRRMLVSQPAFIDFGCMSWANDPDHLDPQPSLQITRSETGVCFGSVYDKIVGMVTGHYKRSPGIPKYAIPFHILWNCPYGFIEDIPAECKNFIEVELSDHPTPQSDDDDYF